jgi:hypothetical protein
VRVKKLAVGEYLSSWLILWRHFHTSLSAKSTELYTGIPLAIFPVKEGSENIFRNQKTEGRQ